MTDRSPTPQDAYAAVSEAVGDVMVGNEELMNRLTIALLTRGHVLLEGVPGVAKTTAARLFASALDLDYGRVQMTPDILPADITGTHVYKEKKGEFELQRGPIFTNLMLADEINRATPKTQSALLESMQERSVTIEGETLPLPTPFMVIATQNPIEHDGTFELPEAQRDRFQFKLTMDIPNRSQERELLDRFDLDPELSPETVEAALTPEAIVELRRKVSNVYVADQVKEYILDLVTETRKAPNVEHGASPRATLAFLNSAKANAAIQGRDYVIPDDVKSLADAILTHRLVLTAEAELSDRQAADIVDEIVSQVRPPGANMDLSPPPEAQADDD